MTDQTPTIRLDLSQADLEFLIWAMEFIEGGPGVKDETEALRDELRLRFRMAERDLENKNKRAMKKQK